MGIFSSIIKLFKPKKKKPTPEKGVDTEIIDLFGQLITEENPQSYNFPSANPIKSTSKIGCIIVGSSRYFSTETISSLKTYIQNGLPTVAIIDSNFQRDSNFKIYDDLNKYDTFNLCLVPRYVSIIDRLSYAIDILNTDYLAIFTPLNQINRRSWLTECEKIVTSSDYDAYIPGSILDGSDKIENRISDPFLTSLSGILFKKDFLKQALASKTDVKNYWIGKFLLTQKDISYTYYNQFISNIIPSNKFFLNDVVYLYKEWVSRTDESNCEERLDELLLAVNSIRKNCDLKRSNLSFIISISSLAVAHCVNFLSEEEFDNYQYLFSSIFNFDQILKREEIQKTHVSILNLLIKKENNTIAIIESEGMEDLKYSLVPLLTKYKIIYVKKHQYYDYHFFNCLVVRTLIQPAKLLLSSNDMPLFMTRDLPFFVLWHGLGMLKSIVAPNRKTHPITYLTTSSKECVPSWSESFNIEPERILPIGSIQTDRLFDQTYIETTKKAVREKYKIQKNAKLVFFAPTFRLAEPRYYNFGLDIDSFAELLEKENIYVITKRHHVFYSIMRDKGIDTSGVKNSKNGHFIVSEDYEFVDLLSASDVFMTDYSSGLFYAVVLNLPIVLYAPDLDEYLSGVNGLMIQYPNDIPAEFVGKADGDLLIKAIKNSDKLVESSKYKTFKQIHVGACDGKVGERALEIIDCIMNNYDHKSIICPES